MFDLHWDSIIHIFGTRPYWTDKVLRILKICKFADGAYSFHSQVSSDWWIPLGTFVYFWDARDFTVILTQSRCILRYFFKSVRNNDRRFDEARDPTTTWFDISAVRTISIKSRTIEKFWKFDELIWWSSDFDLGCIRMCSQWRTSKMAVRAALISISHLNDWPFLFMIGLRIKIPSGHWNSSK